MRLRRANQGGSLDPDIARRFADFNNTNSTPKGRRYPEDLRKLVCQAINGGTKAAEIVRATGLSATALKRWLSDYRTRLPRRIEVVADPAVVPPTIAALVRLPSGVTIELADSRALEPELLASLSTVGVRHAATR